MKKRIGFVLLALCLCPVSYTHLAGDERRRADFVKLRIAQRLDMRHQHMAQLGGKADCRFCRKVLRGNRAEQTDAAQRDQPQACLLYTSQAG